MSLGVRDRFGVDRRALAAMTALILGTCGIGFIVAAGLDGPSRPTAIVVPDATRSPEALDNVPTPTLPAVPDPTVVIPDATPPDPAPPPSPSVPLIPVPQSPEDEPDDDAPAAPIPSAPAPTPTTPTPPVVPTRKRTSPAPAPAPIPAPAPPAPRARPAPSDGNDRFRPDPAAAPLPQFVIPAAELPPTLPAAAAILTARQAAPGVTAATRREIAHVLGLARTHGGSPVPGRAAMVTRAVQANAWWYRLRPARSDRVLVMDPSGLIYSYRPGQGFIVNPVGTAGRWQSMNVTFTPAQLAEALLGIGTAEVRGGRGTVTWEYFDGTGAASRPGVSGMAQSRVGQLMASAYRATGDGRFARASRDAIATLSVAVDDGGARSLVRYPEDTAPAAWMVERAYPGADPWTGAALNGFMVAILELRAAERALRDSPQAAASPDPVAATQAADLARQLADEGIVTLERYLPLHDSGTWSYYGLLTPGYGWRTLLASTSYHCYHITLLRSLSRVYPERTFAATADTWQGYASRRGARCS